MYRQRKTRTISLSPRVCPALQICIHGSNELYMDSLVFTKCEPHIHSQMWNEREFSNVQNYNKIYIHSILCHPARFDGLVSLFKLQFICLYHFDKVNDLIYFAECKRTYTHFYGVHTPYTLHTHINVLILICLRLARKWFRVECIIKYHLVARFCSANLVRWFIFLLSFLPPS